MQMSQVKKLQKGGSITIDGIKYDATPEFIQALTSHIGSTAGTDAQTLAGLTNALQNGEELTYNSASNTISGMNGLWGGITDKQNEHRGANTSRWRKFWDAQLDTDAHRFRNALSAIGSFHFQVPKTEEAPLDLANIYGDRTWYEYNTADDGTKTWLENSSTNIGIAKRLADMTDYLSDIEAGKKKYKLGEWYSPERIDALKGLYGQYDKDTWNNEITAIGERAKNNQLTPEDIAFLKNFNIVDPGETSNQPTNTGLSATDRTKWNNAGHGGLADLLGDRAHINDDGSISLNDGESWGWSLDDLEGRNIWFNDDFFNSRYGADGTFEPYRNYTLYNNRLYALNNPVLARILDSDGGFNAMKKAGNWTGADDIILTRFTDAARENPNYLASDSYSTFLSGNPTYRFSDLTGRYTVNGMDKDDQLIQYVDLNDNTLIGPYRNYGYKYAILDRRGNLKTDNVDTASIIEVPGGAARETGLGTYKRTVGKNNDVYNDRYYEDILDSKGDATGFRFYNSIDNPDEDVILHMPRINGAGVDSDQDIVLPKEIAQILMNNIKQNGDNSWLNKTVGNAQNKKNFINILSSLIKSRIAQRDNTGLPFDLRLNERSQLRKMGFSDVEVEQLKNALKNYRKGSRSQRRENMLVTAPAFQKNGGVLKEQSGGRSGGSKVSTGITEKRVNTINTNPKNSAGIAEIGGNNWTDADTADIAALIADIGSLGLAFVPGANVGSAATGAAGSTARLYADLNRGTKGAGWNYLLNLGMDAATLVPLLGGVSKEAKIVKGIKTALPTIIKAASVYGLGAGVVDTAKKIASGQKFTVRDVDMVVNALTAGVGLTKSGGLGKSSKSSKSKVYSENFKVGNNDVTLDDAAIKKVLASSDQPKALRDAIRVKAPNATNEEVAKAAENLLTTKRTMWQRVRSKDGDIVVNAKKKTSTTTNTVDANGNKFHDWWYGVGDRQRSYNAQLRGEPLTRQEIVLPTGEGAQLMLLESNLPAVVRTINTPKQGVALPQFINPFTKANRQENIDVQPAGFVMQPLYKKGGKIEKAQLGEEFQKYLDDQQDAINLSLVPKNKPASTTNNVLQGTFSAEKYNPDLTVPMNWARSLYAMKQSDKQLKNFLNRPDYQASDLLLNAPRYINTGTGEAYRKEANKLRLSKPVTSDAMQNDLMARDRQREALNAELQGNLADSQEYGQYKVGLDNFNRDYTQKKYNIAEQNKQLRWQRGVEDVMQKNANIAEKSKFFDQAAYATQDWWTRNWQIKGAIDSQRAYTNELKDLDKWYNEEMTKHTNKYKDDPNSDAAAQNLALINSQLALRKNNLGSSGRASMISPGLRLMWGYKNGGKVSDGKRSAVTYSKDPYPELLLQNSKDSAQAVKQLNDAVIKLLLQTKPINVH